MPPLTRRAFLYACGSVVAALPRPRLALASDAVRAGLIAPAAAPETAAVLAGAELATVEAQRTATLMGGSFQLLARQITTPEQARQEAQRLRDEGASVIAGGIEPAVSIAIHEIAGDEFLEIRARRTLEPAAGPCPFASLTPSYETHLTALLGALERHGISAFDRDDGMPDAPQVPAAGEEGSVAVGSAAPRLLAAVRSQAGAGLAVPIAWHHSLRLYGAAQLNQRFTARTGKAMDENAWYGWLAVKLIIEAALRRSPLSATQIDGHKGKALSFVDGRLRQPLYVLIARGEQEPEVLDA